MSPELLRSLADQFEQATTQEERARIARITWEGTSHDIEVELRKTEPDFDHIEKMEWVRLFSIDEMRK